MLVMLCTVMAANAYDFMEGGLAYNINADGTSVTVTYEQKSTSLGWSDELNAMLYSPAYTNLSGALSIPASVTHNGQTYSVTTIGHHAFEACLSLTSIAIPATVTVMENNLFDYCDALVTMTVDENNPVYDSRDNCNAIMTKQAVVVTNGLYETISYDKDQVAYGCSGSVVPSSATSVGPYAFRGCRTLKSLVLPEGVTMIDHHSFVDCGFESLTLPSTLTEIRNSAFHDCASLMDVYAYFNPEDVAIPNNVWQFTLMNPEWSHPVNMHVYPEYVEWFENEYANNLSTSPWAYDGYTFNVMGDLGQDEPEKVYILGEVNDKSWAPNDGVEMTYNDNGLYTADVFFDGRGKNGENYFSFTTLLAEYNDEGSWNYIEPFRFGAVSEGDYWFSDDQLGSEISLTFDEYQAIRIMGGNYTLTLNLEDMKLVITKESEPLLGDVNLDGKVDVTDMNIVINIILGKDNAANYDGRADVNNSDSVDVSDVNAIINILLGKGINEE